MTYYRPSKRASRTAHSIAGPESTVADCGVVLNAGTTWDYVPWAARYCPKCARVLKPPAPKYNEAEELLSIHLAELGVPYEREYRYVPGRAFRADFAIPQHKILIEVQGGVFTGQAHGSVSGVLRDNERLNHATRHGWFMLRFTPTDVKCGAAKEWIKTVMEEQK